MDDEIPLAGGGRTAVGRRGDVVYRPVEAWTPAVHALLRHLENVGFEAAPRLVGSGISADGREQTTFVAGTFNQPGPFTDAGLAELGRIVRRLHDATATFVPPADARWFDWHGREWGSATGNRIISHCDLAPWNVVIRDDLPVALIDWEFAGPVDELVALAQVCWLNVKLHDDVVAEMEGLPPLADRVRQLRLLVDGYRMPAAQRHGLVQAMIEFVLSEVAWEADDANVFPGVETYAAGPWGMAWRARAGRWMMRNRAVLENALA
ncbi:MAG TPA: phosphotransferase [Actinopolymorphaceae bacterium]|jgi:hypothetical protein